MNPRAQALQAALQQLNSLADNDLEGVWRAVTATEAADAFSEVLPVLIDTYGEAAAALAADWYEEVRAADEVPGAFTAIPADAGDRGGVELARWATANINPAKAATIAAAKTLMQGGLTRRINDFARETVMQSTIADPRATGWQRDGVGHNCGFCNMLIGRGAVYSERSVRFASHDHCNCLAVPAWGGRELAVKPFVPSQRQISDADRARAKAFIAANNL